MSLTPKEWSKADYKGTTPDANLCHETYFNTDDCYLYRLVDFILVQEPDREEIERTMLDVRGDGHEEEVSSVVLAPGLRRWYAVFEKAEALVDKSARLALQYDEFRNSMTGTFYRVKNSAKSQSTPRGLTPEQESEASTYDYVPGVSTARTPPQRRGATRTHVPSDSELEEMKKGDFPDQPISLEVR